MAVVSVKDERIKKLIITSDEQLLELAERLAPGMRDAILEFFIAKKDIPEDDTQKFEPFEEPDEDNIAGIDNEFYEDEGEI